MIWMCAAKAASPFIGKHLKGESDRAGCVIIGQHRCIEMVSANEMGQLPINAYRTSIFIGALPGFVTRDKKEGILRLSHETFATAGGRNPT